MAEQEDNRSFPQNMQGLIKFCLENTKSEDASGEQQSDFSEISEERQKWLQVALQEMEANDPVKVMMEHLKTLGHEEDDDEESLSLKEDILEDLKEYCEDIDLACTFHKIGGFSYTTRFLKGDHTGLKWRAADLVASLVQNNPYCQKVAIELHYLQWLLKLVDQDANDMVRVKALYALSCLTREYADSEKIFMENDGLSVLLRAMQSDVEKLKIKATFMLSSLCQSQPIVKDTLCDMGMVDQLVGMLQTEHSQFHEHLMSTLLSLVQDHPMSRTECQKPELCLEATLQSRIELLAKKEEYLEEYEYSKQLLNICFPGSQNSVVER